MVTRHVRHNSVTIRPTGDFYESYYNNSVINNSTYSVGLKEQTEPSPTLGQTSLKLRSI